MSWVAAPEDIPRLVEMGRAFHEVAPHGAIAEFDEPAVIRVLRYLMDSPGGLILMNAAGAIGGLLVPLYFAPSKQLMEISFWSVPKGGKAMLRQFEAEARSMGACGCHLSVFVDGREHLAERLLRHLGYCAVERRFMKEF